MNSQSSALTADTKCSMDVKEIEALRNELRNYNFHLRERERLQNEIDAIQYALNGVRGVSFEVHVPSTNPEDKSNQMYSLMERRDRLIEEKLRHDVAVEYVQKVLMRIPSDVRIMLTDIYIKRRRFYDVAQEHNRSVHGVQSRIASALKKIGEGK